jgi:hypothetical protein
LTIPGNSFAFNGALIGGFTKHGIDITILFYSAAPTIVTAAWLSTANQRGNNAA